MKLCPEDNEIELEDRKGKSEPDPCGVALYSLCYQAHTMDGEISHPAVNLF